MIGDADKIVVSSVADLQSIPLFSRPFSLNVRRFNGLKLHLL